MQNLPEEGGFVTLKLLRELKMKLASSEEEIKKYNIEQDGNMIKWNAEAIEPIDFEIGEKTIEIIAKQLKNLDKQEKLTQQMYSIYEKFVEIPGEDKDDKD